MPVTQQILKDIGAYLNLVAEVKSFLDIELKTASGEKKKRLVRFRARLNGILK